MKDKELEVYNVCHTCQLQGLRNCSEFDKCGSTTTYPFELRENVLRWYEANHSINIIAEKSYDAGAHHADPIAVERTVREVLEILLPYKGLAEVYEQEIDTLIIQIQNLKK